jgi:diaminopimelate epimerase
MKTFIVHKYQGTGNDFVMVNSFEKEVELSVKEIQNICNRRFGIGADGLILIKKDKESDFYCDYYNSDGSQSFCGNGARCAVKFAFEQNIISGTKTRFNAIDGIHFAEKQNDLISLEMLPVKRISKNKEDYVLNTGSPHYVSFKPIKDTNIIEYGKSIRYSPEFYNDGINVNIAEESNKELKMLTYERGVESETYSCGTGATAVGLVYFEENDINKGNININVKGGKLNVRAHKQSGTWEDIWLTGPAQFVFKTEWIV